MKHAAVTGRTAGILYPGEMGCAVAKALVADGWRVGTHLRRPGLVCRGDAQAAAVVDLGSLGEVLGASDVVISLVPPAAALEVAQAVAAAAERTRHRPLYVDANSIAPATMAEVAAAVRAAGLDAVDGAFVGSAAAVGRRTRLYLSGPGAEALARVLPGALKPSVLAGGPGAASAFKLAFAGFNKGLVGLLLATLEAGAQAGRPDELLACLRVFYPGTVETLERLLPTYPRHAPRRVAEMDELAAWLESEGGDAALAMAVRGVIARLAALELDGEREWTFADVAEAWLAAGRDDGSAGSTGGAATG
jgi:3-hydroxyisobutyrate dehydrogenase-like beta-hydroxyacid dehydrogenase